MEIKELLKYPNIGKISRKEKNAEKVRRAIQCTLGSKIVDQSLKKAEIELNFCTKFRLIYR